MKRFLIGTISAALVAGAAFAQPIPLFENDGVMVTGTNDPPQVDALAFANYGTFVVNTSFPFDFTDVRSFTNRGTMESLQGFIFDTAFSTGKRVPAQNFVNASGATIRADDGFSLGFGPLSSASVPSILFVSATNVTVQGILSAGAGGLMRISGNNVDLTRGGLEVRPVAPGGTFTFPGSTNFFPDSGITDIYWASTNGYMTTSTLLSLSAIATNVNVPSHTITNAGGFQGNAQFRLNNPLSFVQTNRVTETNWLVQGAFIGIADPNLGGQAVMANGPIPTNLFKTVVVQLFMPETNVVTGNVTFQYLYLKDDLASNTNYFLSENFQAPGNFRPASYELSRSPPNEWFTGAPPTGQLKPDLFFDTSLSNNFVTNFYAAYSASISAAPVDLPQVPDLKLTNLPGRVEIKADTLNLNRTRIRGNAVVDIQTPNLLSSSNALVDSPNLNFNLGAIQHVLNVTNLAKQTVARLSGQLRAWSAVWTNNSGVIVTNVAPDPADATLMVTNVSTNVIEIGYHIFAVDTTGLQTQTPVVTHALRLHATDVVLSDNLNVIENFLVDANSLTLKGNLTLSDKVSDWVGTNAPNLKFFTNQGTLFVLNAARFTDARSPYTSFVNQGLINVAGMRLKTDYFENAGAINVSDDGLSVEMTTGLLQGGSVTSASGDVVYTAKDLKFFNYTNNLGGMLTLNVTGGLADSGLGSANLWTVRDGFALPAKPSSGDLLGTTIRTIAPRFNTISHTWAAENRGPSSAGFANNAAVGSLVLDSQADGTLFLSGTGTNNAMYVDFLALTNGVLTAFQTGNLQTALEIDSNMIIYFASANVPAEQLDGQLGGKLVWVKEFQGPNSSVDVLLRSGRIQQMNRAVRESTAIDSDGDGIPNFYDQFPLDPDTTLALTAVTMSTPPPTVSFAWAAKALTVYRVEYTPIAGSGDWRLLKYYTNDTATVRSAIIQDAVSSGAAQRYYRVQAVQQLK